jgi:dTDP-glucose 4,6-dehydratase
VTILDSLTYAANLERLSSVITDPRLKIVKGSILNGPLLEELISVNDLVVNFAAETHVDNSIMSPNEFLKTNILGVQEILNSLMRHRNVRFAHVSTDEVYGEVLAGSSTEDAPLNPSSPYSVSKTAGELLIIAAARTYGIEYIITRGCNTYGPGQYPEKIIPLFITLGLQGKPVPIYGDGMQTREWIHVEDHCRGIWLAANSEKTNQIYNLGSGYELSNIELTECISAALGITNFEFEHVADRPGHDRRYSIDSSKAKDLLGFKTRIGFIQGLAETISLTKLQS